MQQRTEDGSHLYARATPRLQAVIRDLVVQATILLCLVVPPTFLSNQDLLRVLAPVCLLAFVLYEPLLIALRGATLGHGSMNLRIVRARDFGRVSTRGARPLLPPPRSQPPPRHRPPPRKALHSSTTVTLRQAADRMPDGP